MEKDTFTIAYFYYSFYPVVGGASVHGFNIAKHLSVRGHRLLKINGDPDPYTEKKEGFLGFIYTLIVSEIFFVRIDFLLKPRNLMPIIGKLMGKKVVVELNSPSDELLLMGYSKKYKKWMERWMRFLVRSADKMLVVSDKVKQFSEQILNHSNVSVLENGGEVFEDENLQVSSTFGKEIESIRKYYEKIVIWAGSGNRIQEHNELRKLALALDSNYALVVMSSKNLEIEKELRNKENIYFFFQPNRDHVKLAMLRADIGLAFFTSYEWCRWGFYGSSLKIYEYLCNGLWVITNTEVLLNINPAISLIQEPENINSLIEDINIKASGKIEGRTWKQVAEEFENHLRSII